MLQEIYHGPTNGVFGCGVFGLLINRIDSSRILKPLKGEGGTLCYEASLPKYGRAVVQLKEYPNGNSRLTLDGDESRLFLELRERIEKENDLFLKNSADSKKSVLAN
jgi:hypothetical protein|tara:strand:+ start:295 stop:615 length:321 start_codon:yes stop_codon:yes gene_type:complete